MAGTRPAMTIEDRTAGATTKYTKDTKQNWTSSQAGLAVRPWCLATTNLLAWNSPNTPSR